MSKELSKGYEPAEVESRRYQFWMERGDFAASDDASRPAFCITIPPPNVTGELHMGHAMQHSIHDLVLRRKRMQGFNALCVAGTDHAGIGTQIKVEQALRKEGLNRRDMCREAFNARAREWTLMYGGTILGQLKSLGCSYDWGRTRFTLDEFVDEGPHTADWAQGQIYERSGYARGVLTAFVHFYQQGWFYRGERIVNWCPQCQTVVSDLEVEHKELKSHLWHLRYPAADGGEGLVVATTRPETMLGDTGVAVSPSDERYATLVGKKVRLPLMDRDIPVVADHHVDASFGTGAVKVTPAHDPNDWDIAQRHPEALLPPINVIGDDGTMTGHAGTFAGMPRKAARKAVLEALEEQGLLVETEDYSHSVGHHDKCGTVIEPLLKLQWFCRMRALADKASAVVEQNRVTFTPERFRQPQLDWLTNIRDWCVSRQLWWGHRIPLWYCLDCDPAVKVVEAEGAERRLDIREDARPTASLERPASCPHCNGKNLEQDPDVLDTWFSSALWPHGVLGWPEKTADLDTFYPTDLMITGRDILYLWVARMIMTGEEFLGKEPFREVLVHATVLTEDGKRMSKSLGTGVDPLELIKLYGADATRFGLTSLVTDNQDIRFKMLWKSGSKKAKGPDDTLERAEQIEQSRFFCNKLWNISRFVLLSLGEAPLQKITLEQFAESAKADFAQSQGRLTVETAESAPSSGTISLQLSDRWILSRLATTIAAVNDAVDRYALGEASWALYHFVWDEFADWYVELAKPRLRALESDSPNSQVPGPSGDSEDDGDGGAPSESLDRTPLLRHSNTPAAKDDPIREVLLTVLETTLRLAHPFLPFITEEIWQSLPGTPEGAALINAPYPTPAPTLIDEAAERDMERVMEVTRAVRNLKAELRVPEKHVIVSISGGEDLERAYVEQSAKCTLTDAPPEGAASTALAAGCELAIAMAGLIDVEAEKARARKDLEALAKELAGVEGKLNNEQFLSRAPADIIEKQKAAQAALLEKRAKLEERLRSLG